MASCMVNCCPGLMSSLRLVAHFARSCYCPPGLPAAPVESFTAVVSALARFGGATPGKEVPCAPGWLLSTVLVTLGSKSLAPGCAPLDGVAHGHDGLCLMWVLL